MSRSRPNVSTVSITTTQPRPNGRPSKFPQIDLVKLEEIARNGYTVAQMADHFKISKRTFNDYRKYPEFRDALRRSRAFADYEVEQALFRRAMGYSHTCDVVVYGDQARVLTLMKYQPPSVSAARLWLSNRQPEKWSRKPMDPPEPDEEDFSVDLSLLPAKDREHILESRRILRKYEELDQLIFVPPGKSLKNRTRTSRRLRYKKKDGRKHINP